MTGSPLILNYHISVSIRKSAQARSLHACWTRMLYYDRLETTEKFFQGHNWLIYYPDSEFRSHWKTVALSSISPNLSKHWRCLAFWLSLWFGSFLLFLVCHDTAFLFSTRATTFRTWCHSFSTAMKFRIRVVSWSIVALKKFEGKKLRIFKKMLFSKEGLLNADKRQQIAITIISICLFCSKSRAFTRP